MEQAQQPNMAMEQPSMSSDLPLVQSLTASELPPAQLLTFK